MTSILFVLLPAGVLHQYFFRMDIANYSLFFRLFVCLFVLDEWNSRDESSFVDHII